MSKGFHEGPYMTLNGGIRNFSADDNARTGARVGRNWEPEIGLNFGWNITDYFAPELQARYTTNKTNGNREHIVNVNINAVYFLVLESMTGLKSVKFLPFIQAGPAMQVAAVPEDPAVGTGKLTYIAPGLGTGLGIRMMFATYGYVGILGQADFLSIPSRSQNIGGVDTTIVRGGWDTQLGLTALAGVHF